MKLNGRKPAKPIQLDCESCGAVEPAPGEFVRYEGFVVCDECARTKKAQLSRRRARMDAKMREALATFYRGRME